MPCGYQSLFGLDLRQESFNHLNRGSSNKEYGKFFFSKLDVAELELEECLDFFRFNPYLITSQVLSFSSEMNLLERIDG